MKTQVSPYPITPSAFKNSNDLNEEQNIFPNGLKYNLELSNFIERELEKCSKHGKDIILQ